MSGQAHGPRIAAHRGASRVAQENTVEAFRLARALGAHMVELDVRLVGDALVVHHDPLDGPPPPFAPSLADALDSCAGMAVNIEIKNDPREAGYDPDGRVAERVVALLNARQEPRETWLISSFDPMQLAAVRRIDPTLATGLLYHRRLLDDEGLVAAAAAAGHRALHPHDPLVTTELVERAHRAGLHVNVWTVDEPDRLRELVAIGVDTIITNVPDVALAVMAGEVPAV